tara:strand:- start:363 stop:998 length:636 start_codon:yes stop_codon:yes gene_type:complete
LDIYATEKEQIDQIKKWWGEYGKAIIFGLVLGLGGLFGYRYWESTRLAEGQNASINYEHLLAVASTGASDEAIEAGDAIIAGYPKSAYAKLSALILAKLAVDARDLDEAKARLQWVIDNSDDGKIKPVAQKRLVQIYLAENNLEDAASTLTQMDPAFENQFSELRGDVFLAQGKLELARSKYNKALEEIQKRGQAGEYIRLKIDNLSVSGQ